MPDVSPLWLVEARRRFAKTLEDLRVGEPIEVVPLCELCDDPVRLDQPYVVGVDGAWTHESCIQSDV